MNSLTENEWLAYVAGIIDGEGCIRIISPKLGSLQVTVYNTCKSVIDKLYASFGGSVWERPKSIGKDGCHRKTMYSWTLSGHKAEFLLRQCYPYFIIKKPHAKVVLKIRAGVNDHMPVSPGEFHRRQLLVAELKKLNRKGW